MNEIMSDCIEHEDFIRIYENAVSREFCRGVIDYFEWCQSTNRTIGRDYSKKTSINDNATLMNPTNFWDINFAKDHLGEYLKEFNDVFWNECYPHYVREFDVIDNFTQHTIFTYKVQKTIPGQGYHVWHCESDNASFSRRIATYILYLNDVVEGGETEFLYMRKRVYPKEGSLVIFPAGYTHTHRGNPPLRGSKYIMTGWIEFN